MKFEETQRTQKIMNLYKMNNRIRELLHNLISDKLDVLSYAFGESKNLCCRSCIMKIISYYLTNEDCKIRALIDILNSGFEDIHNNGVKCLRNSTFSGNLIRCIEDNGVFYHRETYYFLMFNMKEAFIQYLMCLDRSYIAEIFRQEINSYTITLIKDPKLLDLFDISVITKMVNIMIDKKNNKEHILFAKTLRYLLDHRNKIQIFKNIKNTETYLLSSDEKKMIMNYCVTRMNIKEVSDIYRKILNP